MVEHAPSLSPDLHTLSLNLRYRPLRIGWCVEAGDWEAVRLAMRMSFVLWGGRFNPIIPIDDRDHAEALIKLFRVDALHAVSQTEATKRFAESFKHLPWPTLNDGPFGKNYGPTKASVVDIHHPISKIYEDEFRHKFEGQPPLLLHEWDESDPLADILLATFGGQPSVELTGTDYVGKASQALLGQRCVLQADAPLPPPAQMMSFGFLSRAYLKQHYSVQNHWPGSGFYVGSADIFEDLIAFWNLRACDVHVVFEDVRYPARNSLVRGPWAEHCLTEYGPSEHTVTLWSRNEIAPEHADQFGDHQLRYTLSSHAWNGHNLRAPIMMFGDGSALAAVGEQYGKTTASFAVNDLPFVKHPDIDQQLYVLSVDPGIGLSDDRTTLHLPFIPALNEFYGRNCGFEWNGARAEPGGTGFITPAYQDHISLRAVDVPQMIVELFASVGIEAEISNAGRVVTTLIRQMGGVDNCRAFKIEGVRRLIENHRPDDSFSRSTAKQTIGGQGDCRPMSLYSQLFIEPRPFKEKLTSDAVLKHLLEKGVFRAGLNFACPNCDLQFWSTLDEAKSRMECHFCGHSFGVSSQLKDKDWAFRRSGLFGRDDHQGGGIPVSLTLQQLIRVSGTSTPVHVAGMTLRPSGADIPHCESDFVLVSERGADSRVQVLIGECKTRQPITESDVSNLIAVADAFPPGEFDVFIVFSKLEKFSREEIELMRTANTKYRQRAILLTQDELEPFRPYQNAKHDLGMHVASFADMARATHRLFFE